MPWRGWLLVGSGIGTAFGFVLFAVLLGQSMRRQAEILEGKR